MAGRRRTGLSALLQNHLVRLARQATSLTTYIRSANYFNITVPPRPGGASWQATSSNPTVLNAILIAGGPPTRYQIVGLTPGFAVLKLQASDDPQLFVEINIRVAP